MAGPSGSEKGQELALVSDTHSSDSESDEEDKCFVGIVGQCDITLDLLQAITLSKEDEIVRSSSRGPAVLEILEQLEMNTGGIEFKEFEKAALQDVMKCVSDSQGSRMRVMKSFHQCRLSSTLRARWLSCISTLHLSHNACNSSDITLQVLLKRMMNAIVKSMTSSYPQPVSQPVPITEREENAIRYMAGYVAMKLKNKYSKNSECMGVLAAINSTSTTIEPSTDSIEEYTRIWVEQRDRGGLNHVSDDFFSLIKRIEMVCRKHLDTRSPLLDNLHLIEEDALRACTQMHIWDSVHEPTDIRNEVLKSIIKLWCTVRIHSFSEVWTDKIHKNQRKGTRKTLKQKGTDKA